jgi:hypothetical protein
MFEHRPDRQWSWHAWREIRQWKLNRCQGVSDSWFEWSCQRPIIDHRIVHGIYHGISRIASSIIFHYIPFHYIPLYSSKFEKITKKLRKNSKKLQTLMPIVSHSIKFHLNPPHLFQFNQTSTIIFTFNPILSFSHIDYHYRRFHDISSYVLMLMIIIITGGSKKFIRLRQSSKEFNTNQFNFACL